MSFGCFGFRTANEIFPLLSHAEGEVTLGARTSGFGFEFVNETVRKGLNQVSFRPCPQRQDFQRLRLDPEKRRCRANKIAVDLQGHQRLCFDGE